ncbi:MAG: cation-transporting ATPase [Acidimicrobiia bacterium]|nr:cation-transporting ATPase [Acidimicrobiia bacterium]
MSSTDTTTVTVIGMTCEHCVRSVREELTKLDGVADVDVDLASGQVTLHTSAPVEPDAVRAAVEEAGYEVSS